MHALRMSLPSNLDSMSSPLKARAIFGDVLRQLSFRCVFRARVGLRFFMYRKSFFKGGENDHCYMWGSPMALFSSLEIFESCEFV